MNEEIKEMLDTLKKLGNKQASELYYYITNLQEENERIKKMNMHEHKYGSEMEDKYLIEKDKIDKAIEYIEKNKYKARTITSVAYGQMNIYEICCEVDNLLNILRGDKDE